MARPRYPKSDGSLPAALPPETRTVGQLVAETLRLYGRRFRVALPLGLAVAVINQAAGDRPSLVQAVVLAAAAPLMAAAYVGGSLVALDARPPARRIAVAVVVGSVVF